MIGVNGLFTNGNKDTQPSGLYYETGLCWNAKFYVLEGCNLSPE